MPSDNQEGSVVGNAVYAIVTVAFLLGAFPMTMMTFGPLYKSVTACNWETTEAVVVSSHLSVPHRRQYQIETVYRYNWQGEAFTGERVFFDEMVGLRKAYYHDANRELLRHKNESNPLMIWLDPNAPENAVI